MAEETEPTQQGSSPSSDPLIRSPLRGEVDRRSFLSALGFGWAAFTAATAGILGAMGRFLFPNVLFEPPQE